MDDTVRKLMTYWGIDQKWLNDVVSKALKERYAKGGYWDRELHYDGCADGIVLETAEGKTKYTWLRIGKFAQEFIANGK